MVTEDGPDLASALLALTEGATNGQGPAGVLTALVRAADRLQGAAAGAATGGPEGVDAGSLVVSADDPAGVLAAGFEDGPGATASEPDGP